MNLVNPARRLSTAQRAVRQALGSRRGSSELAGLLSLGLLAGAALALLLAPKPGRELRRDVREFVRGLAMRARGIANSGYALLPGVLPLPQRAKKRKSD